MPDAVSFQQDSRAHHMHAVQALLTPGAPFPPAPHLTTGHPVLHTPAAAWQRRAHHSQLSHLHQRAQRSSRACRWGCRHSRPACRVLGSSHPCMFGSCTALHVAGLHAAGPPSNPTSGKPLNPIRKPSAAAAVAAACCRRGVQGRAPHGAGAVPQCACHLPNQRLGPVWGRPRSAVSCPDKASCTASCVPYL